MTLLIFYLLLAVLVSFFCSVAEAVLLSVRPSYIALLEAQGSGSGKKLKKSFNNLDRPPAAILTANTIAHTVGAAGVGAQANPGTLPIQASSGVMIPSAIDRI